MKPMRVEFCRLDARDDFYTKYSPAAFCAHETYNDPPTKLGPRNARLQMELEREYLTRILALQSELRAKYLSKFVADDKPLKNDDYDGFPSMAAHDKARAEVAEMFPADDKAIDALYYT